MLEGYFFYADLKRKCVKCIEPVMYRLLAHKLINFKCRIIYTKNTELISRKTYFKTFY